MGPSLLPISGSWFVFVSQTLLPPIFVSISHLLLEKVKANNDAAAAAGDVKALGNTAVDILPSRRLLVPGLSWEPFPSLTGCCPAL